MDWLEAYRARAAKVRAENERARREEARQAAQVEALLTPRNALRARCQKAAPYHPRSFGRIAAGARAAGRVSLFDAQFKWWWIEMRFAALLSPAQQRRLSGALCAATRGGWDEDLAGQYIGADGLLVDHWPDKWPGSTRLSDLAGEMVARHPDMTPSQIIGACIVVQNRAERGEEVLNGKR